MMNRQQQREYQCEDCGEVPIRNGVCPHGCANGTDTMTTKNTRTNITFTVKVIHTGDQYGRNNCLTHDKEEPLVEFFDARNNQFVSRYYLSTLLRKDQWSVGRPSLAETGLCLDGGVPDWTIDAAGMKPVIAWLERL